jgi:hypothetical protein
VPGTWCLAPAVAPAGSQDDGLQRDKESMALNYRNFYKRFLQCLTLDLTIRAGSLLLGWLSLVGISSFLLSENPIFRWIHLVLFFLGISTILGWFFLQWKKMAKLRIFCEMMARQNPGFKDIWDGIELSQSKPRSGISEALTHAFLQTLQRALDQQEPKKIIRVESLRKKVRFLVGSFSILGILLGAPPHIAVYGFQQLFYGSNIELERYVRVFPKGGRVVYGTPVTIEMELLGLQRPLPELWIKTSAGWEQALAEGEGPKQWVRLGPVMDKIVYQVRWRRLQSRSYALLAILPIRFTEVRIQLTPPAYTGLRPEVLYDQQNISAFRGTHLELRAHLSQALKSIRMVSSTGPSYPVEPIERQKIRTAFTIHQPFQFHFETEDAEPWSIFEKINYTVSIKEDERPQVTLLAPWSDLMVDPDSKIPLTFEVRDDIGVSQVRVRLKGTQRALEKTILLKRFVAGTKQAIETVDFSLVGLGIQPGDKVALRLEAQDNDTVQGPKSSFSRAILVDIKDFEQAHQSIHQQLRAFHENLVDLFQLQMQAKIELDAWKTEPFSDIEKELNALQSLDQQLQHLTKAQELENSLEKILEDMEHDPLMDSRLMREYQAMLQHLKNTRTGSMQEARTHLEAFQLEAASQAQSVSITELESMSLLAEKLDRYGNLNDLMQSVNKINERGEQMYKNLSSDFKAEAPDLAMLQGLLEETMQILNDVRRQLEDHPQRLPEKFADRAEVKRLDLGEIAQHAQALARALKEQDWTRALSVAKKMLEQAQKARNALRDAAANMAPWEDAILTQSLEQNRKRMQQVVDQQEKLFQETNRLDSKQAQIKLDLQKTLLADLAKRQEKVVVKSREMVQELSQESSEHSVVISLLKTLHPVVVTMEKVWNELKESNIIFSQEWLEELIKGLDQNERLILDYKRNQIAVDPKFKEVWIDRIEEEQAWIGNEEKEILEILRQGPKSLPPFKGEALSDLEALAKEQKQLSQATEKLSSDIEALSRQSALLGHETLGSLKKASQEMEEATGLLKEQNTASAQERQQRALALLRQGQESLQNTEQSLGQMKDSGGFAQGQTLIPMRGGRDGFRGARHGTVPIPRADEFLPPRQFREEILESLQERYPKSEEDSIKGYYKRLSQ